MKYLGIPKMDLPENCFQCRFLDTEYVSLEHGKVQRPSYTCSLNYVDVLTNFEKEYKDKRPDECKLEQLKVAPLFQN